MATLVTGTLPCEEFVLAETLQAVPEATIEIETLVEIGDGTVLPLVWAQAPDLDQLDDALRMDSTIETVDVLASFDEERLYRLTWTTTTAFIVGMLTANDAILLSATAANGRWTLRVLYPDHDGIRATQDTCETHNVRFEIEAVREIDRADLGRHGLTTKQSETLELACRRGYFAIPREVDLEAIADELGISHQALSERLRRGIQTLVGNALLTEPLDTTAPAERYPAE